MKSIKKILSLSLLAGSLFYAAVPFYCKELNTRVVNDSPILETKKHLEEVLNEERKVLGIDSQIQIEIQLVHPFFLGSVGAIEKISKDYYKIYIGTPRKAIVQHELYHIADGHLEYFTNSPSFFKKFHYFYWAEPQAAAYAAWGWKL